METYRELERFAEKFTEDPATQCWRWTAAKASNGYGLFKLRGQQRLAHRVVYEYCAGPIPLGFEIDHACGQRACVAPHHLSAVTRAQNERFKVTRDRTHHEVNKTHCPQGHPYSGANLYIRPSGKRACRTCNRERNHARYHSKYP